MDNLTYTAFLGHNRAASGPLESVLRQIHELSPSKSTETLLIFQDQDGKQVDFDLRGSMDQILERAGAKPARTGPGRPKLGVTSREISLLPRHWEWLETQPQGASAALRRLVDDAKKQDGGESKIRAKIDAIGRVMSVLGGNLPHFEEAYRALYARDHERLQEQIRGWPTDLRRYIHDALGQPVAS